MGTLKDCPTCGYKTTRDFCTPDCRMRDSDNRIEFVEEERDRLKKKVEELVELVESEINDAFRIGQNLEAKRMQAKLNKIQEGE